MPRGNERTAREHAATQKGGSDDLQIEQELARAALERSMWRRLLPLLGRVRGRVAAAAAIEGLLVGSVFLRPWFIKTIVDARWDRRLVLTMTAGPAGGVGGA